MNGNASGWKQLCGRLVLALVLPVALFGVMECVFALGGWFEPVRLLRVSRHDGIEYVSANPDYGRRFIARKNPPMPSHVWTTLEKPEGVLRVVILGESAAAGFPHPEFSLGRVVDSIWAHQFPHRPIEVINLTMVAVNSHILRLFAKESLELEPDAFVLYAGHNEAIGPYGPVSVLGRAYSSTWLVRAGLFVRNLRVGRMVSSVMTGMSGRGGAGLPAWAGLDEFQGTELSREDPRLDAMARHTAQNFDEILEMAAGQGIRTLVCAPAVNLTDWPPLASAPEVIEDAAVIDAWRNGRLDDIPSAWQVYRVARQCAEAGDWNVAWSLYRLACDLDLYRFRADSRIRDAILGSAWQRSPDMVRTLDIDRLLHEDNPIFLSDRDFFTEHVHLSFTGRALVGVMIVDGLSRLLGLPHRGEGESLTVADIASRLLFTPVDEHIMWSETWDLFSLSVFASQPEAGERRDFLASTLQALDRRIASTWRVEDFEQAYQFARSADPGDPMVDMIAGRVLAGFARWEPAVEALRRGLAAWPNYYRAWLNLTRALMHQEQYAEAERAVNRAEHLAPADPRIPAIKGELYARSGNFEQARACLEAAVTEGRPGYGTLVNLANVYLLLDHSEEAMDVYAECLEIDPNDPGVLNNYAWLLASSDNSTTERRAEALSYIRRALKFRPEYPPFQATHALVLAAVGEIEAAHSEADQAIAGLQALGDSQTIRELREALAVLGVKH